LSPASARQLVNAQAPSDGETEAQRGTWLSHLSTADGLAAICGEWGEKAGLSRQGAPRGKQGSSETQEAVDEEQMVQEQGQASEG
jgi:hypothetical protein